MTLFSSFLSVPLSSPLLSSPLSICRWRSTSRPLPLICIMSFSPARCFHTWLKHAGLNGRFWARLEERCHHRRFPLQREIPAKRVFFLTPLCSASFFAETGHKFYVPIFQSHSSSWSGAGRFRRWEAVFSFVTENNVTSLIEGEVTFKNRAVSYLGVTRRSRPFFTQRIVRTSFHPRFLWSRGVPILLFLSRASGAEGKRETLFFSFFFLNSKAKLACKSAMSLRRNTLTARGRTQASNQKRTACTTRNTPNETSQRHKHTWGCRSER